MKRFLVLIIFLMLMLLMVAIVGCSSAETLIAYDCEHYVEWAAGDATLTIARLRENVHELYLLRHEFIHDEGLREFSSHNLSITTNEPMQNFRMRNLYYYQAVDVEEILFSVDDFHPDRPILILGFIWSRPAQVEFIATDINGYETIFYLESADNDAAWFAVLSEPSSLPPY